MPDQAAVSEPELLPAVLAPEEPVAGTATALDGLVTQRRTSAALDRALRRLRADSVAAFNDFGIWTLQLAVGFVDWREDSGAATCAAPLALIPVELEQTAAGTFRLRRTSDGEPAHNPALPLKFEQFGIDWSAVSAVDPLDLPKLLEICQDSLAARPGWQLSDRVVLAPFISHKEAMYQDLKENEHLLIAHDLVRTIAAGSRPVVPSDRFFFEPTAEEQIDRLHPPEQAQLVLDADASQRQAVAAALDGRSFILDGPPGTGKSQTITNMIAGLMHAGRSVLFVSEKAAALDVVLNRLKSVGLDNYALALHSRTTNRQAVAAELGRALDRRSPAATLPAHVLSETQLLREGLSDYASAMNDVRQPLGRSLHDILGRLAQLSEAVVLLPDSRADAAAVPDAIDPNTMDDATLRSILEAAKDLAASWRVTLEGESFAWRGLRVNSGHPQVLLEQAAAALSALQAAAGRYPELLRSGWSITDSTELAVLLSLLEHTEDRPAMPEHWLCAADFEEAVAAPLDAFGSRLALLEAARAAAAGAAGSDWRVLGDSSSRPVPEAYGALTTLSPAAADPSTLTGRQAEARRDTFATTAEMLAGHETVLRGHAALLGLDPPRDASSALRLCAVARLGTAVHRPLAAWLSPGFPTEARAWAEQLSTAIENLRTARAAASAVFGVQVLTAGELTEVVARFETHGNGLGSLLSGQARADRKLVTSWTTSGRWHKSLHGALGLAVRWRATQQDLEAVVRDAQTVLGPYLAGEDTDFAALGSALDLAELLQALAPEAVGDPVRRACLAGQLAHGTEPNAALAAQAEAVHADLTWWRGLALATADSGVDPAVDQLPLDQAAQWLRAHLPTLQAVISEIREVEACRSATRTAEQEMTLGQARAAKRAVRSALELEAGFHAHETADRALLAGLYASDRTDIAAARAGAAWVRDTLLLAGSGQPTPFSAAAAHTLCGLRGDPAVRRRALAWEQACDDLIDCFDEVRAEQLHQIFQGSYDTAAGTMAALLADADGRDQLFTHVRGRRIMQRAGLGEAATQLLDRGLAGDLLPAATERALLQQWVEHLLTTDRRLRPERGTERDALVARFQQADQRLVERSRASVAAACEARRPVRTDLGQANIIRNEAQKKRRHMPVRELLARCREVVPLIKPCMMMSPLTVSQLLPPEYKFDVVIFDEASQVLPQDAVNCIYRGDALIVAGDEKQLPPTAFFASGADGDDEWAEDQPDDYESILSACAGTGMISRLSLRWHYRSRHEDLIAFSNRRFYQGSMVTFPGAHERGEDIGIAFFKSDGTYDRGGRRDNRVEAALVAERVVHHFDTRPELSVGVVALSQTQAQAIEEQVQQALIERPDLVSRLTEDRLDGFFVKNLESVQGDERDVMILSVGYGRDEHGKLATNFGPINKEGGWRRLNVAATRARRRVEVVASFHGGELPDSSNLSVQRLKEYLQYAEFGPSVLAGTAADPGAETESPFEDEVLGTLRSWGYQVQPQVGVAGYRIDLGVRHPAAPGSYSLGIECDGAMYHSSRAARDRDRLRENVLRGLGWELHRIWGTDWYRNRPLAEERLREAVERSISTDPFARSSGDLAEESGATQHAGPAMRSSAAATRLPADKPMEPLQESKRPEPTTSVSPPNWTRPYVMTSTAELRHLRRELCERYGVTGVELHLSAVQRPIADVISRVLTYEAPIHEDLLLLRVRTAWDIQRAGARIRDNVFGALAFLCRSGLAVHAGGFTDLPQAEQSRVRTPVEGCLRKVGQIPPTERQQAVQHLVSDSPGISDGELIREVARLFGWNRLGSDISTALTSDIAALLTTDRLRRSATGLLAGEQSS
ncbi:very-short-patch-repair endonuclease [Kitasatospora sp. GAS1066B]